MGLLERKCKLCPNRTSHKLLEFINGLGEKVYLCKKCVTEIRRTV